MLLTWIIGGILVISILVGLFVVSSKRAYRRAGFTSMPAHPTLDDVKRLARAGQKIAAIKCYREIHNVGLAEAKRAVEGIPITD